MIEFVCVFASNFELDAAKKKFESDFFHSLFCWHEYKRFLFTKDKS